MTVRDGRPRCGTMEARVVDRPGCRRPGAVVARPRRVRAGPLETRRPQARGPQAPSPHDRQKETPMSKRGRKRRSRAGSAANHGKRPNA